MILSLVLGRESNLRAGSPPRNGPLTLRLPDAFDADDEIIDENVLEEADLQQERVKFRKIADDVADLQKRAKESGLDFDEFLDQQGLSTEEARQRWLLSRGSFSFWDSVS